MNVKLYYWKDKNGVWREELRTNTGEPIRNAMVLSTQPDESSIGLQENRVLVTLSMKKEDVKQYFDQDGPPDPEVGRKA